MVLDTKKKIFSNFAATNVGDEGGFAPNIQDNKEGRRPGILKCS